ncbi:MAG TPA: SagB/ThcOx family dehydrogenase [Blastocatellia bacterium]|jgi:SagB-type dehydrogenase family enzyme|nr:SagB/ThcOx family dehydrogenase [Blastocatellia bacterium]
MSITSNEADISELYHENTKVLPYELGVEESHLPGPIREGVVLARIALPKVAPGAASGLEQAIEWRMSSREFDAARPLPLDALSRLLSFSCGYTTPLFYDGLTAVEFRHAQPSAGATYPIEVYPIILNAEALKPGAYHYSPNDHSLELLRPGKFHQALSVWTLDQPYLAGAGAVFVLAGFSDRIKPRYGERGYRYMLLEAGHIAQNLYLLCAAYGLGALANGGFIDAAINRLVGLNDVDQIALYTVAVGTVKS